MVDSTLHAVPVRFAGASAARVPMSWGQAAIWRPHVALGPDSHFLNMAAVVCLPTPRPVPDCVGVVSALLARHPALRSRFAAGPDGPTQSVAAAGTIDMALHQASGERAALVAGEVSESMRELPFDPAADPPVRLAAVVDDGLVSHLAVALCHVAVDGWAARIVLAELTAMLTEDDPDLDPVSWTPVDQAAAEHGPEGVRRTEAALRHWRRGLTAMPASMFDIPRTDPAPVRFHRLLLRSAALAAAATLLSARHRVSTSAVILAGVALTLSAFTGHDTATLQLIVGNRHMPRSRKLVAACAQNGLLVQRYDPARTVVDAIRDTHQAATRAYFHGAYDPFAVDRLAVEIGAGRGVYLDRDVYFNDARMGDDWTGVPAGSLDQLRRSTRVDAVGTLASHDTRFFAHLAHHPSECQLFVWVDTTYLPVPVAERLLRGLEETVLRAVREPLTVGEIPALVGPVPVRDQSWVRTVGGWVQPAAVARTVAAAAGVADVPVVTDEDHGFSRLTAHLPAHADTTAVHQRVLAALHHRTGVCAPHRYLRTGQPA